jgi:hypothetical protein
MPRLTAERLREVLAYDPLTGEFTWRVTRPSRSGRTGSAGTKAGSKDRDGYWMIRIDGALYRSARLAVLWMTGRWPMTRTVDHRDLDKSNDRWSNLRAATFTQNNSNNRGWGEVPFKGVHLNKKRGKFVASITVNKRPRFLGHFDTPEAAHARYCAAAREQFGEFARTE